MPEDLDQQASNMIGQQENTLWVESFRPDTLEGYIGNEHIIEKVKIFISNGDVPHLLFYGSARSEEHTSESSHSQQSRMPSSA
mgnify:CR=1 FL=1